VRRTRIAPRRHAVLRRWQFAQTTSHFSISATILSQPYRVKAVPMANDLSRRWSNSKTTGSV